MKKIIVCLIIVTMMVSISPAYAAGKLTEETENFWVVPDYSTYAYCYAKFKNIGDKPIKVNVGLLEVFDENGDTITSEDSLSAYARYLQPDEYTYVKMYAKIENPDEVTVDDYLLTVTGKSDMDEYTQRLPVVTEYVPSTGNSWFNYDYMYGTITNNTDAPIEDISVVFALLDNDDNILYITSDSLGSNVSLNPGSSVTVRCSVDNDNKENYEELGYTPDRVDAIAYAYIEND